MKKLKPFSAPLNLFILLLVFSCSVNDNIESDANHLNAEATEENVKQKSSLRILPLGDSRVEGGTFNSISYRYFLWENFILENWNVDFVGPLVDPVNYPQVSGKSFDSDHAGIGGFRTIDILNNIDVLINNNYNPDVVLLGIGGNDLTSNIPNSTAINNINNIIDEFQIHNPKITILIEQIAPGRSTAYSEEHFEILAHFNHQIETLSYLQTTENSKVIFVDMHEGWVDDYLSDNTHYNIKGASFIAGRYFKTMRELFN